MDSLRNISSAKEVPASLSPTSPPEYSQVNPNNTRSQIMPPADSIELDEVAANPPATAIAAARTAVAANPPTTAIAAIPTANTASYDIEAQTCGFNDCSCCGIEMCNCGIRRPQFLLLFAIIVVVVAAIVLILWLKKHE